MKSAAEVYAIILSSLFYHLYSVSDANLFIGTMAQEYVYIHNSIVTLLQEDTMHFNNIQRYVYTQNLCMSSQPERLLKIIL